MELNLTPSVYDEETFPDPRYKYPPIPAKMISVMIKRGMITFPISPEQDSNLRFLQMIWSDKAFLRFWLGSIKKDERMIMAELPRYSKIDRYILNVLLSTDSDGNMRKYSTKSIQLMVEKYFGIIPPKDQVKKIRQASYDYKRERAKRSFLVAPLECVGKE